MIVLNHTYTVTPLWHRKFVKKLVKNYNAELINEKLLVMPEDIATGGFFYTEVTEGLSVVIWDLIFKKPIIVKRGKLENDLYVIHYDFSDDMNLIHVEGEKHKIGYKANLGLAVFDNGIANVFEPVVGERVYAMRLLVTSDLLGFSMNNKSLKKLCDNKKEQRKALFFNDHIDSESKLIMHSIKNKSFQDPAFEIYLRGAALRLLAKFTDRYSNFTPIHHYITEKENESLNAVKDYLLENLLHKFPGIPFLAEMAGMSNTKFKIIFKKKFLVTPNSFFLRGKMILAKKLLKSGEFNSVSDVAHQLHYKGLKCFSAKYFEQFGSYPRYDMVRNSKYAKSL
jgi:AraC-like DNA-binding protein